MRAEGSPWGLRGSGEVQRERVRGAGEGVGVCPGKVGTRWVRKRRERRQSGATGVGWVGLDVGGARLGIGTGDVSGGRG